MYTFCIVFGSSFFGKGWQIYNFIIRLENLVCHNNPFIIIYSNTLGQSSIQHSINWVQTEKQIFLYIYIYVYIYMCVCVCVCVCNVKDLGAKIYTKLASNIMLMISLWTWIEPLLSSFREENVLVLLKYQDPFIEYAIFEPCLSCAFFVWAQNSSTIQWIVNFHTSSYSSNSLS